MGFIENANIAVHDYNEKGKELADIIEATNTDELSNKFFKKKLTTGEKVILKEKWIETRLAAIAAANSLPIIP